MRPFGRIGYCLRVKRWLKYMLSRYIDNAFNAAKLVNTITIANMEAFGISVQKTNEIAKELSRIGTNNAELFQMAREVFVKPLNWPRSIFWH